MKSFVDSNGADARQGERSLVDLAAAIGDLRSVKGNDTTSEMTVNMPGGKSVLGQSGVQIKHQGITINPEPGFSVKTKVIPSGLKVFINLCTHEEIDAPSVKNKLNTEGESVKGMNVPLSVGPEHFEKDHSGADCLVYDIIVNPKVIQDSLLDLTGQYRDFLCHLSIQSLEQKYPVLGNLDRQYKLPKLKYMGSTVLSQHVRDKKSTPTIQEVSESKVPNVPKKKSASVELKPEHKECELDLPFRLYWIKCQKSATPCIEEKNNRSNNSSRPDVEVEVESKIPVEFSRNGNGTEYTEPLIIPEKDIKRLSLIMKLSGAIDVTKIEVKISPFKFQVKVPGYKLLLIYLPCAIIPTLTSSYLSRPEGTVNRIEFCVSGDIDRIPWGDKCDVGSKAWLIGQALSGGKEEDDNGGHCESVYGAESGSRVRSESLAGNDEYAEDKFHIKLPSNVDKYTGVVLENDDDCDVDDVFAEDSFHKKDAASSYLISQREQAIKDKWAKHEKEKLERINNPDTNIEYVEVDDYKSGGKYGPPLDPITVEEKSGATVREDLQKASHLLASSFKDSEIGNMFSSTLWSELLE